MIIPPANKYKIFFLPVFFNWRIDKVFQIVIGRQTITNKENHQIYDSFYKRLFRPLLEWNGV